MASLDSNYPEGFRAFDHDPRSPFFEEPASQRCSSCGDVCLSEDLDTHPHIDGLLACPPCLIELETIPYEN